MAIYAKVTVVFDVKGTGWDIVRLLLGKVVVMVDAAAM